jgi:spermidine synthase
MGIKDLLDTTYSYLLGRIVERTTSDVSPCLEVSHINGKYMLNSLHANYSNGMLQKVFEILFKKINIKNRKIKDVLILGFGAGSVASILLDQYKLTCNITGIEKDEKVILLGMKYFDIQRFKNTKVICADAVDYIRENKKLYDLIVVDVYVDNLVPEKIESVEFINQLKKAVTADGMIIFNKMIFDTETDKSSKKLYDTFSKVLGNFQYHNIHQHYTNLMLVYENNPVPKKSKTSTTVLSRQYLF